MIWLFSFLLRAVTSFKLLLTVLVLLFFRSQLALNYFNFLYLQVLFLLLGREKHPFFHFDGFIFSKRNNMFLLHRRLSIFSQKSHVIIPFLLFLFSLLQFLYFLSFHLLCFPNFLNIISDFFVMNLFNKIESLSLIVLQTDPTFWTDRFQINISFDRSCFSLYRRKRILLCFAFASNRWIFWGQTVHFYDLDLLFFLVRKSLSMTATRFIGQSGSMDFSGLTIVANFMTLKRVSFVLCRFPNPNI